MCEVAATLGPVLEIDMGTITQEKVRAKVGVRDLKKIPAYTEVTDKDLMIYRVSAELEEVAEHGWYDENKGQLWEKSEQDAIGEEMRKKLKRTEEGNGGNKEVISLGSLSLSQFEEIKKRSDDLLKAQNEHLSDLGSRKKVEADLEAVMKKIQKMKEEKARQMALISVEEKKILTLERERSNLVDIVNKQQELITQCMLKIEQMEAREQEIKDLMENDMQALNSQNRHEVNDPYVEPVDYIASQESVESFGTKLGIKQGNNAGKDLEKEGPTRRSDRNLDKKDAKIEDLDKERAAEKDNYDKGARGKSADAGGKSGRTSGR